jgi:hypothetical protein
MQSYVTVVLPGDAGIVGPRSIIDQWQQYVGYSKESEVTKDYVRVLNGSLLVIRKIPLAIKKIATIRGMKTYPIRAQTGAVNSAENDS